jgi:putative transposase
MPRLARLVLPDVAMHVVQRGHDRKPCFREDSDRMVYLVLLKDCLESTRCRLHAYCLMTNHVHLLLTPCDPDGCAKLTRNLGQRYVQYFNSRYERSGTLWEGRPYSCLVDSAPYVLGCYRYIELNPVRAGMVSQPAAYAWSSHRSNAGSDEDPLISPHVEYSALSSVVELRHAAYRNLFTQSDDPQFLKQVREATNAGFPLVGLEMKARLSKGERPLERRKPGPRPKDDRRDGNSDTLPLPLC